MSLLFKAATSLSIADAPSTTGSVGHMARETEYLEPQLGFAAHTQHWWLSEASGNWERSLYYVVFKT